ncbi:23S rRNA accumulation protein YceD [Aliidiomarina celeris]|uniref:23S rRNA accumulation protein YceD n=1 Tax=Aliidiomarina celeris TaxID=2249428 RepID=UPI000DE9DB05|nr:23S rRNA accumulation protein YceD [Aliidiomarina celeris]
MQKVRIPITVDPVRSAGKGLSFEGVVPSGNLNRLQEMLLSPCNDPEVFVVFDRDEQNIVYFRGSAKVDVSLTCQRCNEPMSVLVNAEFQYAPVNKKVKAEDLPEYYDAAEMNELGEVSLHEIVEDELIIALPLVAMHTDENCAIDRNTMTFGELPPEAEKKNPFAVLQELKK